MNMENYTKEKEKTLEKIGFESLKLSNGMEMELSKKISEPMNYSEAMEWCTELGGRLPTIKELEALYDEDKEIRSSFLEKTFWSSDMYYGDVWAFDFKKGKRVIRSKEEKLSSASDRISNTANTRSVYVLR